MRSQTAVMHFDIRAPNACWCSSTTITMLFFIFLLHSIVDFSSVRARALVLPIFSSHHIHPFRLCHSLSPLMFHNNLWKCYNILPGCVWGNNVTTNGPEWAGRDGNLKSVWVDFLVRFIQMDTNNWINRRKPRSHWILGEQSTRTHIQKYEETNKKRKRKRERGEDS